MESFKKVGTGIVIASMGWVAFFAAPAFATVNVQNHSPTANTTYVTAEDARIQFAPRDGWSKNRQLFFSATYNWTNDPLVELNEQRTQRLSTLVEGVNTLNVIGGVYLNRRLSLNLDLPLNMIRLRGNSPYDFALGDTRVFAKARLTEDRAPVAIALIPELRAPTGDHSRFLSDGSWGGGMQISAERDFGVLLASLNVGYRYQPGAQFRDLDYRQRVPLAVATYIPLSQRWGANVEANGALTLPPNKSYNPREAYAGARYAASEDVAVLGGASVGSVSNNNSSDFRVIVGLKVSPSSKASLNELPIQVAQARPVAPTAVYTPTRIELSEEVKFLHASSELTAEGYQVLDAVVRVVQSHQSKIQKLLVEGYTNELGTQEYNQKLSEARAATVRAYLISRGVNQDQVTSLGYGMQHPKKIPGASRIEELRENRRVEFKILD